MIAALALFNFGGSRFGIWGAPAIMGIILLIPSLVCQFVMVPRVERIFDRMRRGDCLALWAYSNEEWRQWKDFSPRKAKDDSRVACITRDAVYFEGILDCWSYSSNYWLEAVTIEDDPMPHLSIGYAWDTGQPGVRSATVLVPVPAGQKDQAHDVAAELQSSSV